MKRAIISLLFATAAGNRPCDFYDIAGTPCVAAHSTVRALYAAYNGSLYEVARSSDNMTQDIGVLEPGGFAISVMQDVFCKNSECVITRIYDQSPYRNHLNTAPGGMNNRSHDRGVNASRLKVIVGGHAVYGAYFEAGTGYRADNTSGIATSDDPESIYMVTAGDHYNDHCCFDYGNAETDNNDDGAGAMEAVYWGMWNASRDGWSGGTGSGPWVMADLENGLWAGNQTPYNPDNTPIVAKFVTAMVKGRAGGFALKAADAQSGPLKKLYEGDRPTDYTKMKKQGAIILGIGGDNSNRAVGTFFEGAMTNGYASDAADVAVQANIVQAGYGRNTGSYPPSVLIV